MTISINRRRFMQASSALAVGALATPAGRVLAQTPGELRVATYGGQVGKSVVEAYLKPFEAETGIKAIPISEDFSGAQIELMQKSSSVTIDVGPLSQGSFLQTARKGYLEKIDYSLFKSEDLAGIAPETKHEYGIGFYFYSFNMVYNSKKYPHDKPRPNNWAEYWDVEKFPGVRYLVSGQWGSEGPWEEALLADGVSPDKIYPMDIGRIFASLDKIKPHVRKWWTSGSEIQQLMLSGSGDLMMSYDGRALAAIDQGGPLEMSRNQAKLTFDTWAIPKNGPNVKNAQKFVEFVCRAENQAAFAKIYPTGPINRNALKLLPEEIALKLPNHPKYLKDSILLNGPWYAEVGSDGLTNVQRLVQRWTDWVSQ
ncbi:polyamine ABC transporter substrate-binding protein [Phyllobacterium zundukense]|uniref:Polyamine ABC transporter substrate-binding protein n=1 Tax=Phyllobacterium zundukense TaxID=1867719 RepID=A0ACD4CVI7_9HYPH|nr:polyamine ABC transporter substrate-binding protein [Phyllobacterium zundukense]UXN57589.1 polyamine ABC transporter substrate-binding protein [Phyllobacterium zundukense]